MVRALALMAALGATLVFASPVTAAAPNYILVSGPGLKAPVVLDKWAENHVLLLAVANAPRAKASVARGLARRPRFDVAEFWGWGDKPRPTRPSQANQHGDFYPARGTQPAVFSLTVNGITVPRVAPLRALRVLGRHGIPTRL